MNNNNDTNQIIRSNNNLSLKCICIWYINKTISFSRCITTQHIQYSASAQIEIHSYHLFFAAHRSSTVYSLQSTVLHSHTRNMFSSSFLSYFLFLHIQCTFIEQNILLLNGRYTSARAHIAKITTFELHEFGSDKAVSH